MSQHDFDLFVIGAGSGGVRCARFSAALGARVAIAEDRYFGGTCVNVGCIPKKLFVNAAHFSEEMETAFSYGWNVPVAQFDWPTLIANKDREISRLNGIYRSLLENAKVQVVEGRAVLKGPHEIDVGGKRFTSRHILIATGSWPVMPSIPGIEFALDSNDFFFLPNLPDRVLVVGGGYIAVEFAGILNNLGVDTTLSYRGELFLRSFDQDIRQHLRDALVAKKIKLRFQHQVVALEKRPDGKILATDSTGACDQFDAVIYATGRAPNADSLGLEHTAVQRDERGAIRVNDYFQSDEPSVYAIGDVIGRVQLTPVALAEGMAVAQTLFGPSPKTVNYAAIPTAVFSQPAVGTVGLTETQAREQGIDVAIFRSTFTPLKLSLAEKKEKTLMKLVVDKATDRVLGAHMVGPDAGEIIQGIAIAIGMGATKVQFDQTIGIHPTSAEEFVTMRTPVA